MANPEKQGNNEKLSRIDILDQRIENLKAQRSEALKLQKEKKAKVLKAEKKIRKKQDDHIRTEIGEFVIENKNISVLKGLLSTGLCMQDKMILNDMLSEWICKDVPEKTKSSKKSKN